ncbi:MAG TPA: histidine phosphatase family protein [Tepidisphaeraceae bacterium]|nr:histidine phosphatase family protein [Tepidisphaeraceae bacterium]
MHYPADRGLVKRELRQIACGVYEGRMTTFLLIRHGAHLLGGDTIAGRSPDVHLSPLGHDQARRMAHRVAKLPLKAIYSSPIDRAKETAAHLSDATGLPVQISDALSELDYGDWTRKRLDELRPQPVFKQWNTFRSGTRIPNGESMLQTQGRIVGEMIRLREQHPDECIALVSHGDVIKSAVAYWLGVPLDLFMRIEISLASVSVVAIGDFGPWVLCVNNTSEIQMPF